MKKFKIIIVSLILAGLIAPFASSSPDGLEKVAEEQGFIERAASFLTGLIPDYEVSFIGNEYLAVGLAGVIGVLIVFAVVYGLGKYI